MAESKWIQSIDLSSLKKDMFPMMCDLFDDVYDIVKTNCPTADEQALEHYTRQILEIKMRKIISKFKHES